MDRASLKQNAKLMIKGNMGILVVIALITAALTYLSSMVVVLSLVVTPALSLASCVIYLKLAKGIKPEIKDLFSQFGQFWPALKVTLLTSIYTFLWSLLLIVPGIIKAISYSQAMYILAENPGIGAREALMKSKEMMEGHKMEYFLLELSFIGWIILGAFTCGILYLWLIPYMSATMANFYNYVKPAGHNPAVEAPRYNTIPDYMQ